MQNFKYSDISMKIDTECKLDLVVYAKPVLLHVYIVNNVISKSNWFS